MQKWIRLLFYVSALFLVSGCTGFSYYSQAVQGQLAILTARKPVRTLLENPETPQLLKQQLEKVADILGFAEANGLPVDDSYDSYVDLQRPFVVWNVFAAPADQVSLIQHCFPIAGCVGYKGYFAEADAQAFAGQLKASGYDVFVGGVAAYSTLGWFNDPLLNTFVYREDPRLAAVLFHELAHKVLYVEGDTVFNESFATAVERHLLKAWLDNQGLDAVFTAYLESEQRRDEVIELILQTRRALEVVFGSSDLDAEAKTAAKVQRIVALKAEYRQLQKRWSTGTEFAGWIEQDLNNAHIAAIGAYQSAVPGFLNLLDKSANLEDFFEQARRLGELPKVDRDLVLAKHGHAD